MEIWKNIPGLDNCYYVSNIGNIKSVGRVETGTGRIRKDKMLSLCKDTSGYVNCRMMVDGKQKGFLVHRLVMLAFVGEDKERKFVNHKNGIKTDNRLENLEWCTRSENVKHSFLIGLQSNKGENHPSHKMTWDKVAEIRSKFSPRKYSSRKLASEYGISKTNVLDIVNNKIW